MIFGDQGENLTKDGVERASQAGHETVDAARGLPHAASSVVDDLPGDGALDLGRDAIRTGGAQVARRVTERPVVTLLLAGALGYLAGWAVNRP